MAEPRDFALGDVLSVLTGVLVSRRHMDGVHDLLTYMAGEPVWTHQLPRIAEEAAPEICRQHPDLADIRVPAGMTAEQTLAWLAEQEARYGAHRRLTPLPEADHTSIDPLTEMAMMAPHVPVLPVVIDEEADRG